jgi:hypothetical protein
MAYVKEEGLCPICEKKGIITRKWVVNKYKKKYFYTIYNHNGTLHYLNQSQDQSRKFKKGDIEKILIEKIISEKFKTGLFRISDIKKLLSKDYPDIEANSIGSNLRRLSSLGILENIKKGRNPYFLNAIYKDRLSFVFVSKKVILEDINNDGSFGKHTFLGLIRNDKAWPLYYLPYRLWGDVDTDFKKMEFRAEDISNSEELKPLVIEDKQREKRLLLKLNKPLFPSDSREIGLKFNWSEPKQSYVFSAATFMSHFELSLFSNLPLRVTATLTSSALNEVRDISNEILHKKSRRWNFIYSISLASVQPFSILQVKWKNH